MPVDCRVPPIVAAAKLGKRTTDVMAGTASVALTVALAFSSTVQEGPCAEAHPDQEVNLMAPAVLAAICVTVVPE